MVHHNTVFHRNRRAGVIVAAPEVVGIQALRQLVPVNAPIGEQSGLVKQLDLIIFLFIVQLQAVLDVVQLGVGDFMDGGADGLHLAHPLADGDALIVQIEKAVHIAGDGFQLHGDGGGPAQGFHENLIVLYIAPEVGGKRGQRFALGLAHIKHDNRLEHGDFDFLFLHDDVAVLVPQGQLGVGVQLFLLNFLLKGRGCDDFDALFAALHMAVKLLLPLAVAGHKGGVRLLHMNEHGVVKAVLVKTAHGAEIIHIPLRLEQLLDIGLDAVRNFLEPLLVGLLFSHRHTPFPDH